MNIWAILFCVVWGGCFGYVCTVLWMEATEDDPLIAPHESLGAILLGILIIILLAPVAAYETYKARNPR